ncbi:hypothetical protein AB0M28_18875 [Streptomyces sp. NPDC051940]|uniref:hypothetical protein n=1 Tax=Streptomyces sp. NPDC051940 TaxID=3155675 RepID=UPI0034378550
MGDYFQTIVDLDATAAEADALAARAVAWLVGEGVVAAGQTDCVLGQPLGHPPGPHWAKAVEEEDEDRNPSDGLAVHTGRTVFHGGQGDAESVTCPRCAAETLFYTDEWEEIDGAQVPFTQAVDTWHATGAAEVTCPACARPVPLAEWEWADDYHAFAYLGLEFWNWPPLRPEFVEQVAGVIGHRIRVVWGKL